MDRAFLTCYEEELAHIREMALEFAAMHPAVARNLSLDVAPCPDPYVERLLEGVAYLAARTRLKVDAEGMRLVRGILDALYPDLAGPAPALGSVVLHPGPQVNTLADGHRVRRGTRLVASLRDGLATRAVYSTAQDVVLWPLALEGAEYLPDRGALNAAGLDARRTGGAEAGLRLMLRHSGAGALAELSLDRLVVDFAGGPRGAALFDAIFGWGGPVLVRAAAPDQPFHQCPAPGMVGIRDDEAMLPRLRGAFEGYRLIREYFLMPERFQMMALAGLQPAVRACTGARLEIVIPLSRPAPSLAGLSARDFRLFSTPIVNLFEKECNIVELDPRRSAHAVHADRTRPLDFEIHRLLRVEDADRDGPDVAIHPLYSPRPQAGSGLVFTTERRPRRPNTDETMRGQTRTSYAGDDLFISVAVPAGVTQTAPLRRLDIRALCSNRDLPILDDMPRLAPETGDPISKVEHVTALRRPRAALTAGLPVAGRGGLAGADDLAWRLVGQLSLNHLSLADENHEAAPLRAMLALYADRGDPAIARHARSITQITSRQVVERLGIAGPLCFGKGIEVTLDVDEGPLAGHSTLLLSALLNQLFARYASINAFVRTRTRLSQRQEEVAWPMSPGNRALI